MIGDQIYYMKIENKNRKNIISYTPNLKKFILQIRNQNRTICEKQELEKIKITLT